MRRAYANGLLKHTKTRLSNRAVPLQAKAFEALDRLPSTVSSILFPNARGGRIDFRSFGRRHWKPAQKAAGIEPLRDLYDLRHTYATFALRAGVPVFAVSRFIGSSIAPAAYRGTADGMSGCESPGPFPMGRVGLEPTTLGLKVRADNTQRVATS